MNPWPAAISMVALALSITAAAWATWYARRMTATRYWINGEPVTEDEWKNHVREATGGKP